MNERGKIPPGLPRDKPTISYWQDPPSDIADERTTPDLPSSADYVIVGSGISGACIAYNLLQKRTSASVVMLEARQTSSGATGRNGGHTKAASYRSFPDHERNLGLEEAIKIARLEHANILATQHFAKEHGIDCAINPCYTVDIVLSEQHVESGKTAIKRIRETMGKDDPAAEYEVFDAEEARRRFLTPNALCAFKYFAGSLSAYQFSVGVIKLALKDGLNLQTNTPAESIERLVGGGWKVKTPRGTIVTPNLVLATNGYTAHLLHPMQGLVVPLHGQVVAQRPGSRMPQTGLPTTYSMIYDDGFDYMITRPAGSKFQGDVVIGGGLGKLPNAGISRFGETDDTSLESHTTEYLRECTVDYFGSNWGEDNADGRIRKEWSGIMGVSADGLPYVGPVPDSPGLWISAAFNGHGMVWCLKCAEALVEMMTGDDAAQARLNDWFPQAVRITKERMKIKFEGLTDLTAPGEALFGERD